MIPAMQPHDAEHRLNHASVAKQSFADMCSKPGVWEQEKKQAQEKVDITLCVTLNVKLAAAQTFCIGFAYDWRPTCQVDGMRRSSSLEE